jgi:hypothetical protein
LPRGRSLLDLPQAEIEIARHPLEGGEPFGHRFLAYAKLLEPVRVCIPGPLELLAEALNPVQELLDPASLSLTYGPLEVVEPLGHRFLLGAKVLPVSALALVQTCLERLGASAELEYPVSKVVLGGRRRWWLGS